MSDPICKVVDINTHREPVNPGNGTPAIVARYLADIHPARMHGKTDCGEMLFGLSDGDHFLLWLAEQGYFVVRS